MNNVNIQVQDTITQVNQCLLVELTSIKFSSSINFQRELKKAGKAMLMHRGITKWCVLYLVNKKELRSPWFYSHDRVKQAFDIITRKYGTGNTIIYRD